MENEDGSFYILCSNVEVDDKSINKYMDLEDEETGFNFGEIYIKTKILDKITLLVISDFQTRCLEKANSTTDGACEPVTFYFTI